MVTVVLAAAAAFSAPFGATATPAADVSTTFIYSFNAPGTLYETGRADRSSSPYFWVSSGGKMLIKNGVGKTIQGKLASTDSRRLIYAKMNPLDTGNGYYPQNTFRLIGRSNWQNAENRVDFRIVKTNLTNTPNRGEFSGMFLIGRYKDQNNLYYAGIRHDGRAILKKKISGTYYTLADTEVFGRKEDYDKTSRPNLIPQGKWMSLKASFVNQTNGSVKMDLWIDKKDGKGFVHLLDYVDKGIGGAALATTGKMGIRTDYSDVEFDNLEYRVLR